MVQPLDLTIYGPLKQAWARQVSYYDDANPGQRITDRQVGGILARTWRSVMSTDSIKKRFESSGICPFDPDRVMENSAIFAHNMVVRHEDDEQDLHLREEYNHHVQGSRDRLKRPMQRSQARPMQWSRDRPVQRSRDHRGHLVQRCQGRPVQRSRD